MTKSKPNPKQPKQSAGRRAFFISMRWRFITPLFVVLLLIAVGGAYVIAGNLTGGLQISQENVLLQSSRTISERAGEIYTRQRDEAQRVAFTVGIPEAVLNADALTLEPLLQSLARASDLDSIILTDRNGIEVLGLQAVETQDSRRYALNTGTNISEESVIQSVLTEQQVGATGLLLTPEGLMLYTGVPVMLGDELVGTALVGQTLNTVLNDLQSSAYSELMMYGPDRALMQTTFEETIDRADLNIPGELFAQTINAEGQIPVSEIEIGEMLYQIAYQPFNYGFRTSTTGDTVANTLGVVASVMRDDVPFITELGRQLVALFAAAISGGVVMIAFLGVSRMARRAEKVKETAVALASGEATARTNMRAREEIGAIGQALDDYAVVVEEERTEAQQRQEALRKALRKQRRENAHVIAVMQAIPDGVVVQALDGRVLMMNDEARRLLGSQRVYRSSGLHELADVVQEQLGAQLAPGLYALGDPRRVDFDERVLRAQAAAVISVTNRRMGTVVVLRDITEMVKEERDREALLRRIATDIHQPLMTLARVGANASANMRAEGRSASNMLGSFARELARHAIALQKTIAEMQDLTQVDAPAIKRTQKPLHAETLVWALANEWQQVAQANQLRLHVIIEKRDLFVLGDEKRLRWAIGNILDNAIKYTPPRPNGSGALTLEIKDELEGMAVLRVRDNGVGINKKDLPYVFTRFYRGIPQTKTGDIVRVPGMGQGLYSANQIITAHGGRVSVRSTQGVGTAVYIQLPLTSSESLPITPFGADMEGDTVQLPAEFLVDLEKHNLP